MIKKKYSDGYLMKLWRSAVLKEYNYQCAVCGYGNIEELQCHHIVYRRHAVLRHSWRNGVPVCRIHHEFLHTKNGERWLTENHKYYEWLCSMENVKLKEYLRDNEMSRNEFSVFRYQELTQKLGGDIGSN